MLVTQLKNARLCRHLLHQLECLTIRGSHQAVVSRQSSMSQPPAHVLLSVQSAVPDKNYCERFAEHSVTHSCIGRNNVSIIGDRINTYLNYKCPKTPSSVIEINTPPTVRHILPLDIPGLNETERLTPGLDSGEKLAANDLMRIRRRGMKKHRRQRTNQKIWPIIRKRKFLKMKKKIRIRNEILAKIREKGEKFDAFGEIKERLNYARKNGFYTNIFTGAVGSKFVADIQKKKEIEALKSVMQSARKAGKQS